MYICFWVFVSVSVCQWLYILNYDFIFGCCIVQLYSLGRSVANCVRVDETRILWIVLNLLRARCILFVTPSQTRLFGTFGTELHFHSGEEDRESVYVCMVSLLLLLLYCLVLCPDRDQPRAKCDVLRAFGERNPIHSRGHCSNEVGCECILGMRVCAGREFVASRSGNVRMLWRARDERDPWSGHARRPSGW